MFKDFMKFTGAVIVLLTAAGLGGRATLYRAWQNDPQEMTFDEYVKHSLREVVKKTDEEDTSNNETINDEEDIKDGDLT